MPSFTGGGPKPVSSGSMELAMEVVSLEALEGIRARSTKVDPLGQSSVEMSQVIFCKSCIDLCSLLNSRPINCVGTMAEKNFTALLL